MDDLSGLVYKEYIGDGVYVGFDGYHLWLYTSDGFKVTNKIALEREVYAKLTNYAERLRQTLRNDAKRGD